MVARSTLKNCFCILITFSSMVVIFFITSSFSESLYHSCHLDDTTCSPSKHALRTEDTFSREKCSGKIGRYYLSQSDLRAWQVYRNVCEKANCRFMNASNRSPVALISFPGSGNTWVRGLLEKATGICTGSVFHDFSLMKQGMVGEGVFSGAVLAVKMHHHLNAQKKVNTHLFKSVVLIVRNPFEALVSEWNRRSSKRMNHTSAFSESKSFGENALWNRYVYANSNSWKHLIIQSVSDAANGDYKLLIVKYDNLKEDKVKQISRILHFIGFKFNRSEVGEKLREDFVVFKRRAPEKPFKHFTEKQKIYVNSRLKDTINFLKEKSTYANALGVQKYLKES